MGSKILLIAMLFTTTNLIAQLSETFTQKARAVEYNHAYGVAVGADGTIFLADYDDGLRAYSYNGTSFTNTAHIDDGGKAYGVAVGPDGTVFLANDDDGLRAYSYNGTSFTNTAHIDDGASARGVAVGPGGTVFLANHYDGLRAYSYNGTSFTNTAHIDDGGLALGVDVGADGTVFLANQNDGLRAYSYIGTSFTNTAHIDDGALYTSANGVAIDSDGTVFLANGDDGLRSYSYNGISFTNTAHIDDGGNAKSLTVGADGTVFLANGEDGLRAYFYNRTSFTNTAYIYDGGYALGVAVGSDGTVFLANRDMGMFAYEYSGYDYNSTIEISLNEQEAFVGDTISVPVSVDFPSSKVYNSAELDFSGFQSGLEFLGVDTTGTMVGEAGWTYSLNQTDTLLMTSFNGANTISDSGVFCNLKFLVTGQPNSHVPITIESAVFNTGQDSVNVTNGGVEIQILPVWGDVDGNSLVQAHDASLILKHLVGYDTLSVQGLFNANVTLDSTVSALDASIILEYVVGQIESLPYDTTQGHLAATGELMVENITVGSDDIDFPIYLESGNNILSFESVVEFDNTVLEYESASWSELLSNFAIEVKVVGNKIYVAGASTAPKGESDTFVILHFNKIANINSTEIMIEKYRFNEEDYQTGSPALILVGVEEVKNIPSEYSLSQNYPNPFNPTTTIKYSIPLIVGNGHAHSTTDVTLKIYDILGNEVAKLVNKKQKAGNYEVNFDGKDLTSGVYFYKLTSGNFIESKKMLLIK